MLLARVAIGAEDVPARIDRLLWVNTHGHSLCSKRSVRRAGDVYASGLYPLLYPIGQHLVFQWLTGYWWVSGCVRGTVERKVSHARYQVELVERLDVREASHG